MLIIDYLGVITNNFEIFTVEALKKKMENSISVCLYISGVYIFFNLKKKLKKKKKLLMTS
jgi:hypothetical protein